MLMDFQMEGGQAIAAEIASEMRDVPDQFRMQSHEARTFELHGSVWAIMFASYAVFFAALIISTGQGTAAIFALVISIAYTIMYFGTAAVLNSVSANGEPCRRLKKLAGWKRTPDGWTTRPPTSRF